MSLSPIPGWTRWERGGGCWRPDSRSRPWGSKIGSNDSSSVYATGKALKLILVWKRHTSVNVVLVVLTRQEGSPTANELLYLTIPREVNHVRRWWVADLVWVILLVRLDVTHLSHVLRKHQDFMSKFPAPDEMCTPQLAPSSRHPSSGFS